MVNPSNAAARLSMIAALILITCGDVFAEATDQVFSGPQPGERVPALKTRNIFVDPPVTLDPVSAAGEKPLLLVFVHKRERPAFGLMNALLRYAVSRQKDGLHSAAVFLTGDLTETSNWMRRIRNYFPRDAVVAVSPDGIEGPGSFGLNRDVTMTILIAQRQLVTASFALVQPSIQADGPKIAKALVDVLGGGDPPDLTKFSRQQMQASRRGSARTGNRSDSPMDAELTGLLRQLIQKDASEDDVRTVAGKLDKHLSRNADAKRRVAEIANRIIRAGRLKNYGTPAAQEHLKRWAKTSDDAAGDRVRESKADESSGKKAGENPEQEKSS